MINDDTMWTKVAYATHLIRPWCVEEICYCGRPATHKIEETTGPSYYHPLTAYVCCNDFFGLCSTPETWPDGSDDDHQVTD